jgi:hypothetical protein
MAASSSEQDSFPSGAFPPAGFLSFIAPRCDRLGFITERLAADGVPHTVLEMAGSRNVLVRYPAKAYSGKYRVKCFSAHYDRDPRSPGANDNSAACFQLLSFAARLARSGEVHDCMIAFTDNEEMAAESGSRAQGSFAIAEGWRRLKLDPPWVFSFDCTGRGDLPILSLSAYSAFSLPGRGRAHAPALEMLDPLQAWTQALLERLMPGSWALLPTPYSDNLGYLMGGLPAAALTLLPRDEARVFGKALAENPILEHILLKREFRTATGKRMLDEVLPGTWLRLHGKKDDAASIEPRAFIAMRDLLDSLAAARIPVRSR